MKNFKEELKRQLIDKDGEVDFYNINFKNWPQIEDEDLDLENCEIISISDDEMEMCCGGDWQEPMTLTINMVDDELTVTSSYDGYEEGMSIDSILEYFKK